MYQEVKAHVARNKRMYIFGSQLLVAGITWAIMKGRIDPCSLCRGSTKSLALRGDLEIRPFAFLSKQTNNIFVTIKQEIGRPPYLVHDITDDLWYGSQTKVAKALGASRSTVTRHLQGKRDHVSGHQLERVYPHI